MYREAWWATVHGIAKSQTQLDFMQGSWHVGGDRVISVLQPKELRFQVVKSLAQTRSWLGRSGVSSLCALWARSAS